MSFFDFPYSFYKSINLVIFVIIIFVDCLVIMTTREKVRSFNFVILIYNSYI